MYLTLLALSILLKVGTSYWIPYFLLENISEEKFKELKEEEENAE